MEINMLTKEYVLENGVDFEDLWEEYCSDRVLDNSEEDGGEPFTGLTYETYRNGNLIYYCYYKGGFSEGDFVELYEDGKIKSTQYMKRGRIYGTEKIWYKSGTLKSESNYEYGVCLTFKKWDEQGNLIEEKLEPSEDDIKLRNSQEKWYKEAIASNQQD